MVAQTLLVLRLTHSGVTIGLLAACQFGPVLLLGPYAGAASDRSDKRKLLTWLQTAAMVQSFTLAAAVFTHRATLPVIFCLAAIQGVITAFDNPTRRSFVVEMVSEQLTPNAVSLNSAVMTGSRVVGPAVAGFLVVNYGFGWAFLIDAVSYLAVIGGLLAMRSNELNAVPPRPRERGQTLDGLRYVRRRPDLYVPLLSMTVIGTFAFNFQVTMPLFVTGPLHGGDRQFTTLFSVLSLGSLVGALWAARRNRVHRSQIVMSAAAFGATMLALALAPNFPAALGVAAFVGLASIGYMTSGTAIVQVAADPEYRGRVLALQAMVFLGSTPIGGPIVGAVADRFGPRTAVALGGAACLAAAAWSRRAYRRSDTTAEPGPSFHNVTPPPTTAELPITG